MKLWGNLAFNPVSALTGATLEDLANNVETCRVIRKMMEEGENVANALFTNYGCNLLPFDKISDGFYCSLISKKII